MGLKKIDWQVAAAYAGTIIGAGFASGQELMQFFVRFGMKGLWGVGLAGLFFSILGGITIQMAQRYGFHTYKDLLDLKLGYRISGLIDGLILIFLFLGLSVMLAGSGALFKEHLGMPDLVGVIITEALVIIALMARDEGVLLFNSILTPMLVVIIAFVSVASIMSTPAISQGEVFDPFADSLVAGNWLISSVLYISYNMISGVVVLVALAEDKKNSSYRGGMIGGLILLVLSFGTVTALLQAGSSANSYQIPMLYLAYQVNQPVFYLYGAVLWGAMITTAVADAYGFCRRLQHGWKVPYFIAVLFMSVCVIPFSLYDFSKLVSRVYPLFGYLSLIIIVLLISELIAVGTQYFRQSLKRILGWK